jgi:hypothetical protein
MPLDAWQVAATSPAAVAVHDDGHVFGQRMSPDGREEPRFLALGGQGWARESVRSHG